MAGPYVLSPNKYITQTTGDGLKAYYIPAYHLKYGDGVHFDGLNYPYGEHIFYTDSQPIVLSIFKFVDNHLFSLEGKIVGIFNFSKYANLVLCALFLFLILRNLNLPPWYALFIGLFIAFLSPQITRTLGHYSLSQAFYFPMLWYMLLCFFEKQRPLLLGLSIFVVLIVFGLVHMYYLPIGVIFILGFSFFYGVSQWRKGQLSLKPLAWLNLLAVLALVCVQLLVSQTDQIIGRGTYPFGFFHYHAFLGSVFLPANGPVNDLANAVFAKVTSRHESQVFIGLVAVVFCIMATIRASRSLINKQGLKAFSFTRTPMLNAALWSGVLALIFSMALPFRWNLHYLLDWFPFIRQFRSPARFAWIFYYVVGVYAAYYFYLYLRKQSVMGRRHIFLAGMGLIFLAWGFDVFVYLDHHRKRRSVVYENTYFKKDLNHYSKFLGDNGHQPDDFQAILPLPYISIGSQKFELIMGLDAFSQSVKCSYETGLPVAGGILSRSSITDVSKLLQFFNPPFAGKAILEDLPNQKPLLVIKTEEALNSFETRLLKVCQPIGQLDSMTLYKLELNDLDDDGLLAQRFQNKDTLFENGDFLLSDSLAWVYRNSFIADGEITDRSLTEGKSAFQKNGTFDLYNGSFSEVEFPIEMEASIWVYIDYDHYLFPELRSQQFDDKGKMVSDKVTLPQRVPINDRGWVRAATSFILKSPQDSMHIWMAGDRIRVDEFLIRPMSVDVFYNEQEDGSFMYNNYFVPR